MSVDEPEDLSAQPSRDTFLARLARPVRAAPSLLPGAVIGDKYVVQGVIGAGGMGEVYLARDRSLGRDVAIKRHRQDRDLPRLLREAQAMAKLTHPNVVTVYEVGPLDDGMFVAMEYVPGATLRGHLAAARPSVHQTMALLRMAGEGLAAAHAAGIVHRDFKPENVLVGRDGRAQVSDFGLARQTFLDDLPTVPADAEDPPRASIALTATLPAPGAEATLPGTVMGTPAYMAPEQARGEPADARADQFAFCVVAWEALLGERPDAQPASRPPAGWPLGRVRHWRRVLARGLAPQPSARYPSLRALLDALDAHRWWRGAALAGSAAAALAALAWWLLAPAPLSCEVAGRELDEELVLVRAAAGPGEAAAVLTRWQRDYRGAAQAVCKARVQRAWEPPLLRRAELCLQVQRRTGVALLEGLEGSAAGEAERALRALRLPSPLDCSSPARLLGMPPPPQDSARDEAAVTERAGLAASEVTDEAPPPASGMPWSEAGQALARARRAPSSQRAEALGAARRRALALGDAAVVLAIDAALIEHEAERTRDVSALTRWLEQAASDGAQLAAAAPEASAALYLTAAEAELARRELTPSSRHASTRTEEQAAAWVAKALALVASAPSLLHTEALARRGELQLAMGRLADARTDLAAAQRAATELSGEHGALAVRLAARAAYLLVRAGQAADARPYLELATSATKAAAIAASPLLRREHVATREALGLLALEQGDLRRGIRLLGEAHGAALTPGERRSLATAIALALAHLDLKQPAPAVALLTAELAAQTAVLGQDHGELGLLHYNLAVAHREVGQLERARSSATRAAEQFARAGDLDLSRLALALAAGIATDRGRPQDALLLTGPLIVGEQSAVDPQALAWPRLEHARALIALRTKPRQARQLLLEARRLYELYDSRPQLARIDALLRELDARAD